MDRRAFVTSGALFACGVFASCGSNTSESKTNHNIFTMPSEESHHKRTWMAFVADENIWDEKQIKEVKNNLILIATTIAKYEPVVLLANRRDIDEAKELIASHKTKYTIEVVEAKLNDFWMRDIAPTFVKDYSGKKYAIDFNFNGWGNKQAHNHDTKIASFVAKHNATDIIKSNLILEGGCFEVDGAGTAIMSESCIINNNRNPGKSKKR